MPIGRPSSYTEEIAERICLEIAEGASLRTICAADGMPHMDTVRKWLRDNRGSFVAHYTRAREDQADFYADQMIDIADTTDDPQKARLQIDARKWKASKLAPKKYGERVTNHMVGADDETPIQVTTDRDRAKAMAALITKGKNVGGTG